MKPASRISQISESKTLRVSAMAAQLTAAGHDVINLAVGQPDFDTPDNVKEAAHRAIRAGLTKYTAVDGTPELKQAIIRKFRRENNLEYAANEVIASAGAKQAIYNLSQAVIEPGCEALIPAPYWVSYPDITTLAGGAATFIDAGLEQNFKITPAQLAAAITPRTRLLMLNSPNNPTGSVYSAEELRGLAEVLLARPEVLIASDDIYEHVLLADTPFVSIVNVCPELKDRTIIINGVSKAYAMTGWRIGYSAGPAAIVAAMKKIQSQSASNPSSISQAAAQEALDHGTEFIQEKRAVYVARYQAMAEELADIKNLKLPDSEGSFYIFPDFSEIIRAQGDWRNDIELAQHILTEAHVALVPGSAFGSPNHLRFSFSCEIDRLREGVQRVKNLLERG